MRQERTIQATIFEVFAQHEIGCELKAMSQWLDGQPQLTSLVAGDLRRQGVRETGRHGLPAESVLRCALLKQQRQLSYEELAFHLEDSASFRAFARLPLRWSPKKSVLHQTIAAIRAATWEAINQALLASAKHDRLESGATVRLDSTVTAALMRTGPATARCYQMRCGSSRRRSPASSAPTAPPVAPGTDWTTSRPTSGPPWWRTTWCCSPGSNRLSRARLQGDEKPANPPSPTARLPIPAQVVATSARNALVAHRAHVVPPLLHR